MFRTLLSHAETSAVLMMVCSIHFTTSLVSTMFVIYFESPFIFHGTEFKSGYKESSSSERKVTINNTGRRGNQSRKKLKTSVQARCRHQCHRRLNFNNFKRSGRHRFTFSSLLCLLLFVVDKYFSVVRWHVHCIFIFCIILGESVQACLSVFRNDQTFLYLQSLIY